MKERLKALLKRRRKLDRKVERRQNWRQKARKLQGVLGKKIGKRLNGLIKALTKQIKALHKDLIQVEHDIEQLQAAIEESKDNKKKKFLAFLHAQVGVAEGSALQRKWAADLGYSWTLPWCSIFMATGLVTAGFPPSWLPTNPAYSGAWINWAHGKRVSWADREAGDLLIFDWGDGGITDHVAAYVGDDMKIGGNESDKVSAPNPVPVGNLVAVIRPDWN